MMTKELSLIIMAIAVVLMTFQVFIENNFDRFGFAVGYFMYDLLPSGED